MFRYDRPAKNSQRVSSAISSGRVANRSWKRHRLQIGSSVSNLTVLQEKYDLESPNRVQAIKKMFKITFRYLLAHTNDNNQSRNSWRAYGSSNFGSFRKLLQDFSLQVKVHAQKRSFSKRATTRRKILSKVPSKVQGRKTSKRWQIAMAKSLQQRDEQKGAATRVWRGPGKRNEWWKKGPAFELWRSRRIDTVGSPSKPYFSSEN